MSRMALKSAQNAYYKLMIDKPFNCKNVIIGYNHSEKGKCEISLDEFDADILDFDKITHYRTDTKLIWSKVLRIDLLFNSGDTKEQISKNPNVCDIDDDKLKSYMNLTLLIKKEKNVKNRHRKQQRMKKTENQNDNQSNDSIEPQRTALRSAQNAYFKLMIDKPFNCKDVLIGYCDHSIGDCEFLLNRFDQNEHDFERVKYYRTDTQIIWDKHNRIDLLFDSGDTKIKMAKDPKFTHLTVQNMKNMPLYVQKNILSQTQIDDDTEDNDAESSSEHSTEQKKNERATHFLSIRIKNPLLIALATDLQSDILKEYKEEKVQINTSLIKALKFHISINVISLPTECEISQFCKIFKFIQKWLNVYVFGKENEEKFDENVMFMQVMKNCDYLTKIKAIYDGIHQTQNQTKKDQKNKGIDEGKDIINTLLRVIDTQMNESSENSEDVLLQITKNILEYLPNYATNSLKGYPLHLEGVNHFNQKVIFLDFENKCLMPSDIIKMNEEKVTISTVKWVKKKKKKMTKMIKKNEWMLKLIRIIFEIIVRLSDVYKMSVNDTPFIPHCTFMKMSFLKRNQMRKLVKYNRKNGIKLLKNCFDAGLEKKKRRKNDFGVYDAEILAKIMNEECVKKKVEALKQGFDGQFEFAENISQIDLCAMHGANETEDGYYKVLDSLSILKDAKS